LKVTIDEAASGQTFPVTNSGGVWALISKDADGKKK
jgi:hypothetical protein